jgi:hypothetical protein
MGIAHSFIAPNYLGVEDHNNLVAGMICKKPKLRLRMGLVLSRP